MKEKIKKIKLIVLDVDGVLTDAGLMLGHDGFEYMKFNVQDGAGIVLARKLGYQFAIITGRDTQIITTRATQLGIHDVYLKKINKIPAFEDLLKKKKLKTEEVCYMGDDILDIPLLKRAGLAVVPANGNAETKKFADIITQRSGGDGAVRELIDLILDEMGFKEKLISDIEKGLEIGVSV
ncbi:MAG: hypothetical protein A3B70_07060 [Deltaproteobacteria bacterium RIFCSPHIGHO2_02_FULL_40_11]|nr:MAG: hypothetical protein A3B70_07060 [Deltaproteobacteria bacterium RIFCSPHIGHO2_02_FULL_40_11]